LNSADADGRRFFSGLRRTFSQWFRDENAESFSSPHRTQKSLRSDERKRATFADRGAGSGHVGLAVALALEVSRSLRVGQCVRRRCRRGPRQRLYALSIQPTSNWLEASAQTSKSSKSTTHLSQEITQVVVGSAALYADHWHSEHNSYHRPDDRTLAQRSHWEARSGSLTANGVVLSPEPFGGCLPAAAWRDATPLTAAQATFVSDSSSSNGYSACAPHDH
jgi:hypothetical protein